MENALYDALSWANDKDILKIIGTETLYYSNKIQKINHYNISQERFLVLTNQALYNIFKKKLKRKIKYNEILGITFTKLSQEFVVHGLDDEYDYYFQSPEKNILICLIAKFYQEQTNSPLKICEVPEKILKNYVTLKKEKKKDGSNSKMDQNYLINTNSFIKENIRTEKKLRLLSMDNLSDSDDENQKKNKIQIVFFKKAEFSEFQLEDFQIMKILGRGAYGKVYLVFYKNNKEYYAMKSLKIENIKDDKQIYRCIENKKIQNLEFPFLIDVELCFITDDRIYFIMEFVHGEDLLTSIRLNEEKFDEGQVKFYAVLLGLSLQYLHQNRIILKDLHLDNIIIDRTGYLKLINFKIGQLFDIKEESILMKETSEFLSPEVISSNSCRKENDWWSYGIILYQLLFGIPPFYSNDDNEIRQQILYNELRFPKDSNISETAKDLLRLLLKKNPDERLGASNGFDEIKQHKFFEGINFEDIINKQYEPDYKPEVINILKVRENIVEFTYEDLINSKIIVN